MAKGSGFPLQLRLTTGYLHAVSATHLFVGVAVLLNAVFRFLQASIAAFMIVAVLGVILVVLAVGFEIVNAGLRELSYWAWVTALIACSIHLLAAVMLLATLGDWGVFGSLVFLVSGVAGFWGLLAKETRAVFAPTRYLAKQAQLGLNRSWRS